MADDIKRAMEALEREACASLESDDHGINDPAVITFAQAQVVLAALREREKAIEQARKDEREACADAVGMAMMPKTLASDPKVWKARDAALAAIRARGAR